MNVEWHDDYHAVSKRTEVKEYVVWMLCLDHVDCNVSRKMWLKNSCLNT